ncbi:uncharacterized protein LOC144654404 isoform X2 [Oculina patagonica]
MATKQLLYIKVIFILCQMFYGAATQQCEGQEAEYSKLGWMLRRHIFKKMTGVPLSGMCLLHCYQDVRCQSFNYVISRETCEFNNRTKEARPEDFVPDPDRLYFRRDRNRVPLGSIPELPAETCTEIKGSEGGQAVSSKYWFDSILPETTVLAQCDMKTEDIDECSASAPVCDVNAKCTNTRGSYVCSCETGFSGDGKTCSDIDECSASAPVCDVNAKCTNTRGSYVCSCETGFSGDGKTCSDINECTSSAPVCDINANCQNTRGSYVCSCKVGFTGDGKTCADIDECSASAPVCDVNAKCANSRGSYVCSCKTGFSGDGKTCSDIDECSASAPVCDVNANCQNTRGSYVCSCKAGYTGDGKTCSVLTEFTTNGRKGRFGTVQTFTVPRSGRYRIKAWGARGGTHSCNYGDYPGTYYGGKGASMEGTFSLTKGAVLNIVVGQRGGDSVEVKGGQSTTKTAAELGLSVEDNAGTGGGGGSFVYTTSNVLLLAAGGGGGASSGYNGVDGQRGTDGSSSVGKDPSNVRKGGTGGQPGECNTAGGSYHGGVGAGWIAQGCERLGSEHGERGESRVQGWEGGRAGGMNSGYNGGPPPGAVGGFGGGGGGSEDNGGSGGGGGYSGGGSGNNRRQAGGGGGSYCSGGNCSGVTGDNSNDDGLVQIIALLN